MAAARIRLGELLVEAGIVRQAQLDEVLGLQAADDRRLGELLVEAGLVTETQVTQILSQQLSVPWVSLYHVEFSRQLLNLVPQQVAEKHCLVPIFVRKVRGLGQAIYVAMDDPTNEEARREVTEYSGLPVRAMIAPPADIRAAIRAYYSGTESYRPGTSLPPPSQRRPPPRRPPRGKPVSARASGTAEPSPPAAAEPAGTLTEPAVEDCQDAATDTPQRQSYVGRESTVSGATAPQLPGALDATTVQVFPQGSAPVAVQADTADDSEGHVIPRAPSIPTPVSGPTSRMVTLTLLDGTQIELPAKLERASGGAAAGSEQLTARDLVAALCAAAHGADASEILGDKPRWEQVFAALLSLLLKKHLIADWEFVDELRRLSGTAGAGGSPPPPGSERS